MCPDGGFRKSRQTFIIPGRALQQRFHLTFAQHRDPVLKQQFRRYPVSGRQCAGKGSVVYRPAAAGWAALFQDRRLTVQQTAQPQRRLRAAAVWLRHVAPVPLPPAPPPCPKGAGAWAGRPAALGIPAPVHGVPPVFLPMTGAWTPRHTGRGSPVNTPRSAVSCHLPPMARRSRSSS